MLLIRQNSLDEGWAHTARISDTHGKYDNAIPISAGAKNLVRLP
jgi:hypothetical protein